MTDLSSTNSAIVPPVLVENQSNNFTLPVDGLEDQTLMSNQSFDNATEVSTEVVYEPIVPNSLSDEESSDRSETTPLSETLKGNSPWPDDSKIEIDREFETLEKSTNERTSSFDEAAIEIPFLFVNYVYGTAGFDNPFDNPDFEGTHFIDYMYGYGGNDLLVAGDQNDKLYGGDGNDWLAGGNNSDYLEGGLGHDILYGDAGGAFDGNDTILGGLGKDEIYGQGGHDILAGEGGNDYMAGGSGNDLIEGGNGLDRLFGNSGHDQLLGGASSDELDGGAGNDTLMGGFGNDIINGYGDNAPSFSYQIDVLTGDEANSLPEQKNLGDGADTFVLGDQSNVYYTAPGSYAKITDFNRMEGDEIQVHGVISDYSLSLGANWGGVGSQNVLIWHQSDLIGVVLNTPDIKLQWDFTFV
ncbi:MAG: calcium-binding protein [Leptolyngbyaceae cyanobacterium]